MRKKHNLDDVLIRNQINGQKLQEIIEKGATKLSNDKCFTEDNRAIFTNLNICSDECASFHKIFEPVLNKFNGNAKSFYSNFYKLSTENFVFKKFLSKELSMLLCSELSTICLEFLTRKNEPKQPLESKQFTEKDIHCLQYLSGFCF